MPVYQYAGVPVVVLSSIGDIELHSVDEVVVTEENLVTQHPTESGASLSDHIVVLPVRIRLSGRFVDFPLPELGVGSLTAFVPQAGVLTAAAGVAGALASEDARGLSIGMWQALERLRAQKSLVDVNVQQGTYVDMAIKTLTAPRGPGDGGSQRFQMELIQVITSYATVSEDTENVDDEFAHSAPPVLDQGVKSPVEY